MRRLFLVAAIGVGSVRPLSAQSIMAVGVGATVGGSVHRVGALFQNFGGVRADLQDQPAKIPLEIVIRIRPPFSGRVFYEVEGAFRSALTTVASAAAVFPIVASGTFHNLVIRGGYQWGVRDQEHVTIAVGPSFGWFAGPGYRNFGRRSVLGISGAVEVPRFRLGRIHPQIDLRVLRFAAEPKGGHVPAALHAEVSFRLLASVWNLRHQQTDVDR